MVDVDGVLELEKNHFTTIKAQIIQMLSLEETFSEEQGICMVLKCLPTDCLLVAREKFVISQWRNQAAS